MSVNAGRSRRKIVLAVAALVLAGLLAPTYAIYRRDIGPAYDHISTGSQIAQTRCGPLEYAVAGEGRPLLMVHGAGGGFDQGMQLSGALALQGYRVIAVSRFGYLRTPLPADASAEAQADAHACLLDVLNIDRAVIVGVSAGGPSALQFAVRHPDRTAALVLMVPAAYAPRPGDARPARLSRTTAFVFDVILRSDFLFWAAGKLQPRRFMSVVLGTPQEVLAAASPAELARLQLFMDRVQPVRLRRLGLLNDATVVSSLARPDLEAITAPTLAISTPDDLYGTFEGARYSAEHISHARFIGYPSGGHMLVGHNAEALAEITAFLARAARF